MNTERELEALKSLALGRKKASRASRFISDPSKADKNMIPADEHPDKENQSISYNFGAGMGGISFTVE
jgi:hypothetical protein